MWKLGDDSCRSLKAGGEKRALLEGLLCLTIGRKEVVAPGHVQRQDTSHLLGEVKAGTHVASHSTSTVKSREGEHIPAVCLLAFSILIHFRDPCLGNDAAHHGMNQLLRYSPALRHAHRLI